MNYANRVSITFKDQEVLEFVMVFFSCISGFAYFVLNSNAFHLIWH